MVRASSSFCRDRGKPAPPGVATARANLLRVSLIQRAFSILDSRFESRVGNATTLVRILGLGLFLVIGIGLAGAGVIGIAGWLAGVSFALWAVVALLVAASWTMRRRPSTIASPIDQVVIEKSLPGAAAAVLNALITAESTAREGLVGWREVNARRADPG
jgi:hypothetical protein